MSDKFYLSVLWKMVMGYELDWKNPKTFSEKLQWLKFHDHNPLYTKLVDKYRVKQWVADKIGKQYIIPTLEVYDSVDEIDLNKLPDQFVLKCNHDSGSVVICKDKSTFELEVAKKKLGDALKKNFYWEAREWPYKNVKPCIFAEAYLSQNPNENDLPDYKWYCFNGEPKYCQVIQDRTNNETIDIYDADWEHQSFVGLNPKASVAITPPPRPYDLGLQIRIARELSKGMPFSRIDLYEVNQSIYFGEITFYPWGGFGSFRPNQYNEIIGQMITLPGESR